MTLATLINPVNNRTADIDIKDLILIDCEDDNVDMFTAWGDSTQLTYALIDIETLDSEISQYIELGQPDITVIIEGKKYDLVNLTYSSRNERTLYLKLWECYINDGWVKIN